MHAALVIGYGVNLVDDYSLNIAQDDAALLGREQNVKRFGGSDENVRRAFEHSLPVFHQSVTRANRGSNCRHQQAALARHLQNFSQRNLKILLNVIAQRFERRNIEDLSAVLQFASERLTDEPVDAGEKSCQRFARSRGSRDQSRVSGEDVGPALLLRLSGCREARSEPLLNQRMSPSKGSGDCG